VQQHLSKEQAVQKIRHYCAYQERSHKEVKDKLYTYGLRTTVVEEILGLLIEENYLNEERFAKHFAGGKFRIKQWGKLKITHELKLKQVSSYNIQIALESIDEEDYIKTLKKLAAAKWRALKTDTLFVKQSKVNTYLLQKGYERNLITETIKTLLHESS